MSEKRFIWKTEKLQHSDDEVIMVVDNANKDWKGHILNVIDMLNELNDERMIYKTTIDKRIVELEDENEQLKNELRKEKSLREYSDSMIDVDLIINIRFSNGEWKADVSVIDDE